MLTKLNFLSSILVGSMGNYMFYATRRDRDIIRQWINSEPEVAWIVKTSEQDGLCSWKAVHEIDMLEDQNYALWHINSGSLNIWNGRQNVPDEVIGDPFEGWTGKVKTPGATAPWFGGNLPGPYHFGFSDGGREAPGSLGRSDVTWDEDRYKVIGKPAHPEAKRWWNKLIRFIKKSSTPIERTVLKKGKSRLAYVFPDAKLQIEQGRHRDINR